MASAMVLKLDIPARSMADSDEWVDAAVWTPSTRSIDDFEWNMNTPEPDGTEAEHFASSEKAEPESIQDDFSFESESTPFRCKYTARPTQISLWPSAHLNLSNQLVMDAMSTSERRSVSSLPLRDLHPVLEPVPRGSHAFSGLLRFVDYGLGYMPSAHEFEYHHNLTNLPQQPVRISNGFEPHDVRHTSRAMEQWREDHAWQVTIGFNAADAVGFEHSGLLFDVEVVITTNNLVYFLDHGLDWKDEGKIDQPETFKRIESGWRHEYFWQGRGAESALDWKAAITVRSGSFEDISQADCRTLVPRAHMESFLIKQRISEFRYKNVASYANGLWYGNDLVSKEVEVFEEKTHGEAVCFIDPFCPKLFAGC
ncbi:hypothetical protein CTRI78_v000276 [Colletotrichum trifolii]|uniref:Uncharacterized protein n=1 Tax=Colletotrichum trifolii TaxID=5466 RepID=A0A4R8RT24_COLTR|nr:hypothetical protein CTRI78_v000276 [Colletotrichum trifolii]